MTLVLTYFGVRGRADGIRMMLADSCLEWADNMVDDDLWVAIKDTTLLGTLPQLQCCNQHVAQTTAIAFFVSSKIHGLRFPYPHELSITTCIYQELLSPLVALLWGQVRSKGIPFDNLIHSYYKKVMELMPRLSMLLAKNDYYSSSTSPCSSDYLFAHWLHEHCLVFNSPSHTKDIPATLINHCQRIRKRPRVASFLNGSSQRPKRFTRAIPNEQSVLTAISNFQYIPDEYVGNIGRATF